MRAAAIAWLNAQRGQIAYDSADARGLDQIIAAVWTAAARQVEREQ